MSALRVKSGTARRHRAPSTRDPSEHLRILAVAKCWALGVDEHFRLGDSMQTRSQRQGRAVAAAEKGYVQAGGPTMLLAQADEVTE